MPHQLDGCWKRIRRASRYIDEADTLLDAFASECEDRIIANDNTQQPINFPSVPDDLPLAVSDAIHNLRAALDYFVYELAIKDSGKVQEGTQFPLESVKFAIAPSGNKVGFDVVWPRYLKGVSGPHRDLIEQSQPYRVNWTKTLRDISNPDKHRRLTPISKGDVLSAWIFGPNHPGKKLSSGDTLHVDPTHTVFIELPERRIYVVHSLHEIQAAIVETVNAFNGEF